jgi:hypothetical protein
MKFAIFHAKNRETNNALYETFRVAESTLILDFYSPDLKMLGNMLYGMISEHKPEFLKRNETGNSYHIVVLHDITIIGNSLTNESLFIQYVESK